VDASSGGFCPAREAASAAFDIEVCDIVFRGGGSCLFGSFDEVVYDDVCGAVLFSWAGVEYEYFHSGYGFIGVFVVVFAYLHFVSS
jgi:hypothetical protein